MTTKNNGIRQLASGRWQARYRDPEGTLRALGTYATRKLAEQALTVVRADVLRGDWHDSTRGEIKFSEYATRVLEAKRPDLAVGTWRNYQVLMRKHLLPAFGARKLNEISVLDVDAWWGRQRDHLQNRRNGYGVLKVIFKAALREGLISASPCMVVDAGKDVAKPRPDWNLSHALAVIDAASEAFRPMIWTVLGAHLRRGELCALNYSDFWIETGQLVVSKQLQQIGGTRITPTKTGTHKTVTLLAPAQEALTAYVEENPGRPWEALFRGDKGRRIGEAYVRREWERATAAAGFENFHLHDLRHVGLTLVADSGIGAHAVQYRAGHASQWSTRRYLHATAAADIEVAARVNERIFGTPVSLR
ncbi:MULTISPECIES: site-specific integrase [unclassified Frondihabitans]|uniref:tyrosine-type recombinase/integrase n=1 Tax=unclassified Frondihabitans TaxID=2626248 RepID=UPI000F98EC24|nr:MULTISPECIES: site-specific integrase [unclassified Frondihabitans]RPE76478.1 site-specific recombinase XerD [Frondihabitans sp. PhB153]RPF05247.1 site-specific recombinase XerD [Frondihabitans sp. PhB161]